MILLFASLTFAASGDIKLQSVTEKSLLLKEATKLILTYTNMTVLDTRDFKDQVRLLVDDMTHEFGDDFDLLMGKLTLNGHITMVSASSAGFFWPIEPLYIEQQDHTPEKRYNKRLNRQLSSFQKREKEPRRYLPRFLLLYSEERCEFLNYKGYNIFVPGRCIKLEISEVRGGYLSNPFSYLMHISLYHRPYCDPIKKVMYRWHSPHTNVCYDVHTGDSMWWDWPGFNSPHQPLGWLPKSSL